MASAPNASPALSIEPTPVTIPGGWFWMGSKAGQDNERPIHRVWVDAFQLAAYQVTNREYEHFLHATPSQAPPLWDDPNFDHPEQPVVAVSWFDAMKYCEWLSAATDRKSTRLNSSHR